jgi:translation initiation factor 1
MSNKNKFGGMVYSTNSSFSLNENEDEGQETLSPSNQLLHLHRETKGRGGKAVTIVRNFVGSDSDLQTLGKAVKGHCGTGGSAKNGEIIIQGDQREKVKSFLNNKGYKTKNIGG